MLATSSRAEQAIAPNLFNHDIDCIIVLHFEGSWRVIVCYSRAIVQKSNGVDVLPDFVRICPLQFAEFRATLDLEEHLISCRAYDLDVNGAIIFRLDLVLLILSSRLLPVRHPLELSRRWL